MVELVDTPVLGTGAEKFKGSSPFLATNGRSLAWKEKQNMETLSFAFGVLSVVAVILIAVVAVGMVKVIKMQSNIENLYRVIDQTDSHIYQRISNDYQSLDRAMCDDRKELDLRIDNLNSYVDSRFDKMENKFNGNGAKKQIING